MNCQNCFKETSNPKFCSRSCAATYTNKLFPKRKTLKVCKTCGKSLRLKARNTFCSIECRTTPTMSKTLEEVTYITGNRASAYAYVRQHARTIAKQLKFNQCKNCGYNKHIEVCHIKPINSFSKDTILYEINNVSNIIPLCPNCHWEFDNGLLKL